MDRQVDSGWTDGPPWWTDVQDVQLGRENNRWIRQIDVWVDGWTDDGTNDEWMDGWMMELWMDGQMIERMMDG